MSRGINPLTAPWFMAAWAIAAITTGSCSGESIESLTGHNQAVIEGFNDIGKISWHGGQ